MTEILWRKGASAILSSALILTLSGCGAKPAPAEEEAESETEPTAETVTPETSEPRAVENGSSDTDSEWKAKRREAWVDYVQTQAGNDTMHEEIEAQAMKYGDVTMRFTTEVVGEKPENGYPLYIALHGGGEGDTPDVNDSQWEDMQGYYRNNLDCGVYVACRGVRDTYDTHSNPESYPLYDRLIQYMILKEDVDPNRVYLEGFSAGGDGVYQISCRMPDRFAAVNMSSGHPNNIPLDNLYRLPIMLQAGDGDTDYDRNTMTARYGVLLDSLQSEYPDGYEHRVLIHYDRGHNYEDYAADPVQVITNYAEWVSDPANTTPQLETTDSFPPHYMAGFTRNPTPESLIFDLGTRAELRSTEFFYYLSAPYDTKGKITVSVKDNCVIVTTENLEGDFQIWFNEDMIDFDNPVHFSVDGHEKELTLTPDEELLKQTTADRGDPSFQFEASVSYSDLVSD